ncbi:MAG: 2-C-methyl-D-erythritol 4-phosphate cytidylyltransferase [Actinobacteria bacterium]|nr:2-C-methyl-D-erythritol 4-phosphate cytidylyltransferase [Actinomycetota bacterium]NBO35363.1 2-C-methyl-D-erythritol 4-phosphate cytidylyltransferase [Actinomycetota bacterium]
MSTAATGRVAAIIPAAGSGLRLGAEIPKAFLALGGLSLLTRSALAMSTVADVLIVAAPADALDEASAQLAQVDAEIHIVAGGEHRQESVANALRIVPADVSIVLVHDAARPLVPNEVTQNVVAAIRGGAKAAIPVLPLVDTIKRVNNNGIAIETVDRNQLRRVQTPQGFDRATLDLAYQNPEVVATDDAGLMDALGIPVVTVAGDERSLKITTMSDVQHALSLLEATSE